MTSKRRTIFRSRPGPLPFQWVLYLILIQAAFPPAHGQSAPLPADCIFYWGSIQARLNAGNNHHARMELSPDQFRQAIFSTPYVWNGMAVLDSIHFLFESRSVSARRRTFRYLENIAWLDTLYALRPFDEERSYRITGLGLGEGRVGSLEIAVRMPATPAVSGAGAGRTGTDRPAEESRLQQVFWGPHLSRDQPRDFLTAAEFWETVKAMPLTEWAEGQAPGPVGAVVEFPDIGGQSISHRGEVKEHTFQEWFSLLEYYRHLVRPGQRLRLALIQAVEHAELYRADLLIVADDDSRLTLRRDLDGHVLQLEWAGYEHTSPPLYLRSFPAAGGKTAHADPPRVFYPGTLRTGTTVENLWAARPRLRVDGRLVPDLECTLVLNNKRFTVKPGGILPTDSLLAALDEDPSRMISFGLENLKAGGFDLEPISYRLTAWTNYRLPVANSLESLEEAFPGSQVHLSTPRLDSLTAEVVIGFDLPEPSYAMVTVYDSNGWNIFTQDGRLGGAKKEVRMPRPYVRTPGLHRIFLITAWGVARETIRME
jgi:hypothetical protein